MVLVLVLQKKSSTYLYLFNFLLIKATEFVVRINPKVNTKLYSYIKLIVSLLIPDQGINKLLRSLKNWNAIISIALYLLLAASKTTQTDTFSNKF